MDMDCCWQNCLLQQLQGSVWVTIHRYHHAAKGWQHSPHTERQSRGVIGWQSCLLQQLQGSVWVTIHRYHHAAKGWQHSPHTESGSTARIQRDSPGGHWDYVSLGESIRPPRDDHTPRIQKICHTRDANGARNKGKGLTFSISCEVWQRISVSHRVQQMWLMPFVSSMVSLSQPYPPSPSTLRYGLMRPGIWAKHPGLTLPAGTETSRHLGPSYQQGVPILSPLIADLSGLWGSPMQVMHGRPRDYFQDDQEASGILKIIKS